MTGAVEGHIEDNEISVIAYKGPVVHVDIQEEQPVQQLFTNLEFNWRCIIHRCR